jgi:hypothetical protein
MSPELLLYDPPGLDENEEEPLLTTARRTSRSNTLWFYHQGKINT